MDQHVVGAKLVSLLVPRVLPGDIFILWLRPPSAARCSQSSHQGSQAGAWLRSRTAKPVTGVGSCCIRVFWGRAVCEHSGKCKMKASPPLAWSDRFRSEGTYSSVIIRHCQDSSTGVFAEAISSAKPHRYQTRRLLRFARNDGLFPGHSYPLNAYV
jgi:hypothetical protein